MASEELSISIGAHDSGALSTIRQLNSQLKFLDREYQMTRRSSSDFDNTLQGQRAKLSYLNNTYQTTSQKLQVYRQKLDQAQQTLEQRRASLEQLQQAEGDNAAAIERAQAAVQQAQNQLHQAQQNIVLTEQSLENLQNQIDETNAAIENNPINEYRQRMQDLSNSMNSVGERFQNVGRTISGIGDGLLKVATPILTVSAAATKLAVDFESSFAKVSTLLDGNGTNFEEYKQSIIDGSSQMKTSVSDYSEALYEALSSGIDQANATEFTNKAIMLAKGGFTSASNAVDVLTTAINAYNLSAKDTTHISDLLIATQDAGKTTVDELSSSMGQVIPVAKAAGVNLEQLSAGYALLTKNGIATAEAGTYMKSMFQELSKSGTQTDKALRELTGKGFSDLQAEGKNTGEILGLLSEYAAKNGVTLKDMFGSVEAGTAALTIANNNGSDYAEMLQVMANSAGSTQEAFDKIDATPAEQFSGALNELKNAGIELGSSLVPVISTLAEKITGLARWFGSLSEEQQQSIVKFGALTAVSGVALKGIGSLTTGVGTLIKGGSKLVGWLGSSTGLLGRFASSAGVAVGGTSAFGSAIAAVSAVAGPLAVIIGGVTTAVIAYSAANKVSASSCTKAREEYSAMEKVMASLNGTQLKTKKELIETGVVLEDYPDYISKGFGKAMDQAREDVLSFNMELDRMTLDGVLTEEEGNALSERVASACDSAINAINSKQEEIQSSFAEAFNADGVLDQNEQTLIQYYQDTGEKNKQEVQQMQSEINELQRKVREEGYQLTGEDEARIKEYYQRIKQLEIEAQANNQYELEYSQNEYRSRMAQADSETASKLLEERRKYYDDEIASNEAYYDTLIENTKRDMANMNDEQRKAAEEVIKNAEEEKQRKNAIYQQMWEQDYQTAIDGNEKIAETINKYTGEELTNADLKSQEKFEIMKSHYAGLNEITETGVNRLYNAEKNSWENILVSVDENSGEIIGLTQITANEYGAAADDITGYSSNIEAKQKELANEWILNYNRISGSTMNSKNQIVDANGQVVGSLQNIESAADGTKQGIIELNGQKVKVKVDKDGTILDINYINNRLDDATRDRTVNITVRSSEIRTVDYGKYTSDGRGNVYVPDAYAKGTKKAKRGLALIAEEGPELVLDGNNVFLATEMQLHNFKGNEEVFTAQQTKKMMKDDYILGGSYFSPTSYDAQELVSTTTNNYNTTTYTTASNSNNATELMISKMDQIMKELINQMQNMSINMDGNKVGKIVDRSNGRQAAINNRLGGW